MNEYGVILVSTLVENHTYMYTYIKSKSKRLEIGWIVRANVWKWYCCSSPVKQMFGVIQISLQYRSCELWIGVYYLFLKLWNYNETMQIIQRFIIGLIIGSTRVLYARRGRLYTIRLLYSFHFPFKCSISWSNHYDILAIHMYILFIYIYINYGVEKHWLVFDL